MKKNKSGFKRFLWFIKSCFFVLPLVSSPIILNLNQSQFSSNDIQNKDNQIDYLYEIDFEYSFTQTINDPSDNQLPPIVTTDKVNFDNIKFNWKKMIIDKSNINSYSTSFINDYSSNQLNVFDFEKIDTENTNQINQKTYLFNLLSWFIFDNNFYNWNQNNFDLSKLNSNFSKRVSNLKVLNFLDNFNSYTNLNGTFLFNSNFNVNNYQISFISLDNNTTLKWTISKPSFRNLIENYLNYVFILDIYDLISLDYTNGFVKINQQNANVIDYILPIKINSTSFNELNENIQTFFNNTKNLFFEFNFSDNTKKSILIEDLITNKNVFLILIKKTLILLLLKLVS